MQIRKLQQTKYGIHFLALLLSVLHGFCCLGLGSLEEAPAAVYVCMQLLIWLEMLHACV